MKVRTTMRPDEEIDVGEAEYTDLLRQGLLVTEAHQPSKPATQAKTEKKD